MSQEYNDENIDIAKIIKMYMNDMVNYGVKRKKLRLLAATFSILSIM